MPVIPDPTPAWLKPENASVFDSYWTRIARMLAQAAGADDPTSQAVGLMAPIKPIAGPLAKGLTSLKAVGVPEGASVMARARAALAEIRRHGFDLELYDPETGWLATVNEVSDAGRGVGKASRRALPPPAKKALQLFNELVGDDDVAATLLNEP
jgi:hypothetical protein